METLLRFFFFGFGAFSSRTELPLRVALAYRECVYRVMPDTDPGSK